jgi:hypothetical protein
MDNSRNRKALIKYHHGLGDVIQLTPHLRFLYDVGYVTDIMGMAQNRTSHLLDACPYVDKFIDIPNTWKSPLGFQRQLLIDMEKFENLSKGYGWSGYANHIDIGNKNKIDFTSMELGLEIIDKTVEVFITPEIEEEALKFINNNFPNGYIFVHTMIEEHTYHNWDASEWILENLPNLPIVNTGYGGNFFMCHPNINFSFVLAREAKHRVMSSSVMVHACDAMGTTIDLVNYGRADRKVWLADMSRVLNIRECGKFINRIGE